MPDETIAGTWIKFDDNKCSPFDPLSPSAGLDHECFGGAEKGEEKGDMRWNSALMVFYERLEESDGWDGLEDKEREELERARATARQMEAQGRSAMASAVVYEGKSANEGRSGKPRKGEAPVEMRRAHSVEERELADAISAHELAEKLEDDPEAAALAAVEAAEAAEVGSSKIATEAGMGLAPPRLRRAQTALAQERQAALDLADISVALDSVGTETGAGASAGDDAAAAKAALAVRAKLDERRRAKVTVEEALKSHRQKLARLMERDLDEEIFAVNDRLVRVAMLYDPKVTGFLLETVRDCVESTAAWNASGRRTELLVRLCRLAVTVLVQVVLRTRGRPGAAGWSSIIERIFSLCPEAAEWMLYYVCAGVAKLAASDRHDADASADSAGVGNEEVGSNGAMEESKNGDPAAGEKPKGAAGANSSPKNTGSKQNTKSRSIGNWAVDALLDCDALAVRTCFASVLSSAVQSLAVLVPGTEKYNSSSAKAYYGGDGVKAPAGSSSPWMAALEACADALIALVPHASRIGAGRYESYCELWQALAECGGPVRAMLRAKDAVAFLSHLYLGRASPAYYPLPPLCALHRESQARARRAHGKGTNEEVDKEMDAVGLAESASNGSKDTGGANQEGGGDGIGEVNPAEDAQIGPLPHGATVNPLARNKTARSKIDGGGSSASSSSMLHDAVQAAPCARVIKTLAAKQANGSKGTAVKDKPLPELSLRMLWCETLQDKLLEELVQSSHGSQLVAKAKSAIANGKTGKSKNMSSGGGLGGR